MASEARIFGGFDRWLDGSPLGRLYTGILRALSPGAEPNAPTDTTDRAIALALGTLAVLVAVRAMALVPHGLYALSSFDIWFQADQPRALGALTDRLSLLHGRDNVHPLYSLIGFPLADALRHLGASALQAGQGIILLCGFGSTSLLYLVLRHMGLPRLSAALGGGAFLVSATYLHWFGLVETYAMSGFTAIAASYIVLRRPTISPRATIVATIISMSMVLTNWTLGIALSATRWPLSRFLRYMLITLVLCVGLSVAQHRIFPQAGEFFRRYAIEAEERFVAGGEIKPVAGQAPHWLECVRGIMVTSAVAPQPNFDTLPKSGKKILNNQHAPWSSYDLFGDVALGAWGLMLALSALTLATGRRVTPTVLALLGFMLGQVVLHIVYGDITFLYAGDFFVVLMILACQGALGRWRQLHTVALAVFIVSGALANSHALGTASTMASEAVDYAAHLPHAH